MQVLLEADILHFISAEVHSSSSLMIASNNAINWNPSPAYNSPTLCQPEINLILCMAYCMCTTTMVFFFAPLGGYFLAIGWE